MRSYVNVKFRSDKTGRTYAYVAEGSITDLKDYTHAVVDAPSTGLTVVVIHSITELDESTYDGDYKYVVTLFNTSLYEAIINKQRRKDAIEKELRNRVAKKKLEDNFAKLLEGDEEGMRLLNEYKSI